MIDDGSIPRRHKRFVAAVDVEEARTRPWWTIEATERELMVSGVPVMWRRASASVVDHRIFNAAF
ncbi:hypothetical protein [Belnapia moabensis]|uniref:hypothetical protein n=1 Tax=Belnapia moabensis TaxID=365533 RepID=UPI0012ED4D83|nr:hypothetical protein [Belnapia moabensis]